VKVFRSRRVAPMMAVGLGLLALGACLAAVAGGAALHQPAGPGGWATNRSRIRAWIPGRG